MGADDLELREGQVPGKGSVAKQPPQGGAVRGSVPGKGKIPKAAPPNSAPDSKEPSPPESDSGA
jgi:hypothetical protein